MDDSISSCITKLAKKVDSMSKTMGALARQTMLQQLFIEEKIRSDADSGVKQVWHHFDGTRNYYSASHKTLNRVLTIHDHSNKDRSVGMSEFIAVLN